MRYSRIPRFSLGLFLLLLPSIAPSQCLKSQVTDVLVFEKNEQGGVNSIQKINAGGFGYHKQEFR